MSDLFFEIMQLQPNENEFLSAVRDSNSKETAYKLGFMHGRSYAAQMADEDDYRSAKNHERLVDALRNCLSGECDLNDIHNARELLAQLQAGKGGE